MIEPTGYTALDLIGFTDRGVYDPDAYYVKNDITSVGNTKWRCLIDDTHNITPTEGANWTIYLESATSLAGMDDVTLTSPKNGDGLVHDGNDWTNVPIMTKEQWKKNGAYNLLPNNGTTQVSYGLTFTFNPTGYKKGVVHVTGTKSDSGSHGINLSGVFNLKAGTYKILDGLSNNNLGIALIDNSTSTFILQTYNQHKATFTLATDTEVRCTIVFLGAQNTTFDDYIYPMITTDLNATYEDYVPYAKTNRELTELVDDKFFSYFSITDPTKVSFAYGITSATVAGLSISGRKSKDNKFVTLNGWIYMKDCVYSPQVNPVIEVELPFTIPISTDYTIDMGALIKNGATFSSGYAYKDDALVSIRTTVKNKLRIIKHNFAENLVNGVTYYQILPITIAIN